MKFDFMRQGRGGGYLGYGDGNVGFVKTDMDLIYKFLRLANCPLLLPNEIPDD
jgi:hypothetical protein